MSLRRQLVTTLTVAFVALNLLPLWFAVDEAAPAIAGPPTFGGGPAQNGPDFFSSFSVQNLSGTETNVTITYFDANGNMTGLTEQSVCGGCNAFEPITGTGLPSGFNGSAVVSADQEIAAIANLTSNPDGTGTGSAWPLRTPQTSGVNILGLQSKNSTFAMQNTGAADTVLDVYFYSGTGDRTDEFASEPIKSGQIITMTGSALPGGTTNSGYPGWAQAFQQSGVPPSGFTIHNVGNDATTVQVGDDAFLSQASENYCFPGTGLGDQITTTLRSDSTSAGQLLSYDQNGDAVSGSNVAFGGNSQFIGSATINSNATCFVGVSNSPIQGNVLENYEGFDQRGRKRVSAFINTAPLLTDADLMTKSGIAFGAVSSKSSAVSLHVMNMGDKKAKVRVTVRNGQGKKLQAKTLKNIPVRGVGIFEYGKKARGDDLYAEIAVKGSGQVFAWLVRSESGDAQIIPAVKIR